LVERYEWCGWGGHLRGPFGKLRAGSSTGQLAKCASCSAQDDGLWGGLKEDKGNWSGDGLLWAHLFVGGDELPAPGFGEVLEVGVLSADQV
jgi:hypothetical protein